MWIYVGLSWLSGIAFVVEYYDGKKKGRELRAIQCLFMVLAFPVILPFLLGVSLGDTAKKILE